MGNSAGLQFYMKDLQIFNNSEFGAVRCVEVDGKPYVVGIDVAKSLGYAIPHKAVKDHCRWVLTWNVPHPQSPGNYIEMLIIPEGDIYRLIIKAADQGKNPEIRAKADRFEKWVFDEVLPSIRKTGKYELPSPRTITDAIFTLVADPNFQSLKASAQAAAFRAISKDKTLTQKHQPANNANNSKTSTSEKLKELITNAIYVSDFKPRNNSEVTSSVLCDEEFYYIFGHAVNRFLGPEINKLDIYKEIKRLQGKNKIKKFNFFGKEKWKSKAYHIWCLPRWAIDKGQE